MKTNFLSGLKLTVLCILFLSGTYTLFIWGMAQFAPNQGKGITIESNGVKFYKNIGQSFTEAKYFNSRPSAVDYNAAGSGGSNKGPSNPEYLATVQQRIDTFLILNPGTVRKDIPADLVTASGSGLDPNISVAAAKIQVSRIAKIRNITETQLQNLIAVNTEKPVLMVFGPEKINVLQLNIALDNLK